MPVEEPAGRHRSAPARVACRKSSGHGCEPAASGSGAAPPRSMPVLHAPRSVLHAPRSVLHAPCSVLHAPCSLRPAPCLWFLGRLAQSIRCAFARVANPFGAIGTVLGKIDPFC